ncbi:MAG: hypothetical protein MHM6MM_005682 [Cercozoa sp. M6MM]
MDSDFQRLAEDEAAIDMQPETAPSETSTKWHQQIVFRLLIVAVVGGIFMTAGVAVAGGMSSQSDPLMERLGDTGKDPRNVIFFVSDGYGPSSHTMTRLGLGWAAEDPQYETALDSILVGKSKTFSSDSLVTDSAAGAVAFSCALKTYNGAIGVDREAKWCPTVLEAAKIKGLRTGLVATSRITHATPGAFAAHVRVRDEEDKIAEHELAISPDIMLGGGLRHFSPELRRDGKDLLAEATEKGYTFVDNKDDMHAQTELPILGLFANSHMQYDLDRRGIDEFREKEPSLAEMAMFAIERLDEAARKDGKDGGFFIMIEGSRIDHAAHANEPVAHFWDAVAFDETIRQVVDWAKRRGDTLVMSTSDHETGGFSIGRDKVGHPKNYWFNPESLYDYVRSPSWMADQFAADRTLDIAQLYKSNTRSGRVLDDDLVQQLNDLPNDASSYDITPILAQQAGRDLNVGWTTGGHSGVDVNLYAYGPRAAEVVSVRQNTDVGTCTAYENLML